MSRLSIDVKNRAGELQGPGPIVTATGFSYTRRLNRAGDFSFTVPKRDNRTDLIYETLGPKASLVTMYWDDDEEFTGIVENVRTAIDNAGNVFLEVSGRDMLAELAEIPVGFLDLSNSGSGVNDAPAGILTVANTLAPDTWSLDTTDGYSTTTGTVYAKFAGETCLQALIKVADHLGERFRMSGTDLRDLVWLRGVTPSATVRAVQAVGDPVAAESNDNICFILGLDEEVDAYELVNRIYPYGSGVGDTRLTLAATSRSAASGFSLSTANNYLQNSDSITALGATIARYVEFKDIRPVSNTDADVEAAANALYDAAYAWLQRRDEASDTKAYSISVTKLPSSVVAGGTIRVIYEDGAYSIDDEFIVLEITRGIGQDGTRTYDLLVATTDVFPASSEEISAQDIEKGTIFSAHPQMNANSYRENFRVYVGENQTTEKADIRWWFGPEVVQLQQVLLRFNLTPLVAPATTVGGDSEVELDVTIPSHTHTLPDHTHSLPTHTHTTPAHTHSLPTHTHDVPDHTHQIGASQGSGGRNVGVFTGGGLYYEGSDVGVIEFNSTSSGGVTSASGGGGTTPSGGGGTSASGGGGTTPSGGGAISGGGGSGTATGTVDVGAALSTDFGIFSESSGNTFAISDLEYRVNGGSWADLSGATSHGSDWYSVDITSDVYDSATFRPQQEANQIEVRRKSAGATDKTCMLDGALEIRNVIQAITYS